MARTPFNIHPLQTREGSCMACDGHGHNKDAATLSFHLGIFRARLCPDCFKRLIEESHRWLRPALNSE